MLACLWPAPVTIGRPSTSPSMFRASTLARMLPWTQHPLLSTGGLRSTRPGRSKIPAANPMCSPSLSPMPDSSSTLPCKSWSTLGPGRARCRTQAGHRRASRGRRSAQPGYRVSDGPRCRSWGRMHARCWQAPDAAATPGTQTRQPRIFPQRQWLLRGGELHLGQLLRLGLAHPRRPGCAGGDAASFSTAESTENQPYGDTPSPPMSSRAPRTRLGDYDLLGAER